MIKTILKNSGIDFEELKARFEVEDFRSPSSNKYNINLRIETESSITVYLSCSRSEDSFTIQLQHQQDPEVVFEHSKYTGPKDKAMEESVIDIFTNYYILEFRGGRESYLHYLDRNRNFRYSSKCVDFPGLLTGKREFKLYMPLINELI